MPESADTPDFFRPRLAEMIDLRHPLAVLASLDPHQKPAPGRQRRSTFECWKSEMQGVRSALAAPSTHGLGHTALIETSPARRSRCPLPKVLPTSVMLGQLGIARASGCQWLK